MADNAESVALAKKLDELSIRVAHAAKLRDPTVALFKIANELMHLSATLNDGEGAK